MDIEATLQNDRKLRCAVLDDYQNVATRFVDWRPISDRVEIRVFSVHFDDPDKLVTALADFDAVVLMRERTPLPRAVLTRLPRLKLIVTTGARNAVVDMDAAAEAGITVCGTEGHFAPTVEHTWTLMLALARNIVNENMNLRTGDGWQTTVIGADLWGQRLGILGLGKVGAKMTAIAHAFGMEVTAWSQNLTQELAAAAGATLSPSLDALLEACDFVSIHLVLSERTRGLIGRDQLRRMKSSAFLINTSRASIVDRDALLEALREGWIAGAALDVFDVEPLPKGDELRNVRNLLATPHLGHVTRGSYQAYYRDIIADFQAYLAGNPIRVLAAPAVRAAVPVSGR